MSQDFAQKPRRKQTLTPLSTSRDQDENIYPLLLEKWLASQDFTQHPPRKQILTPVSTQETSIKSPTARPKKSG